MSILLDKEIDRILTLLRNKIRERGYTQLEVQEKLGWGRSYISQLLTKQKSLRVEQVLSILETIDVDPREFYADLYCAPGSSGRSQTLDAFSEAPFDDFDLGADLVAGTASLGAYPADFVGRFRELRALVHALIQTLVDKNIVSPDDVVDAARPSETDA